MNNIYLKYKQERKNAQMLKKLKDFGVYKEVRIPLVNLPLSEVRKTQPKAKQSLRVSLPIGTILNLRKRKQEINQEEMHPLRNPPKIPKLVHIHPVTPYGLTMNKRDQETDPEKMDPKRNPFKEPILKFKSHPDAPNALTINNNYQETDTEEMDTKRNPLKKPKLISESHPGAPNALKTNDSHQKTNTEEIDTKRNPFKIPKLIFECHSGAPNALSTNSSHQETNSEEMDTKINPFKIPKLKSEIRPGTANTLTTNLRMVRHTTPVTSPGNVVIRNALKMTITTNKTPGTNEITHHIAKSVNNTLQNANIMQGVKETLPKGNMFTTEEDPSISIKHKLPVSVVPKRGSYGIAARPVNSMDKAVSCVKIHSDQITQTDKVCLITDDELKILDVVTKSGVPIEDLIKLLEKHKKAKEETNDAGLVIDVEEYVAKKNTNIKTLDMAIYHSDYNKNLLIDVLEKIKKNTRPNADVSCPARVSTPCPLTAPPQAPAAAPPPYPPLVSIEPETLKFIKFLHNQYKNNKFNALQQIFEEANKKRKIMQTEDQSDDNSLVIDTEVGQNTLLYPTVVAPSIRSQLTQHNEPQQAVPVRQLNQQAMPVRQLNQQEVPLQNAPQQQIEQLQCQQETLKQHQLQQQLLQQQQMRKQQPQPNVQQTQPPPRVLQQPEEREHDRRMNYRNWQRNNMQQQYQPVSARNNYPNTYEHSDPINPTQMYLYPGDPRAHGIQNQSRMNPGATRYLSTHEANQQSARVNQQADSNYWNNQSYWNQNHRS